MELNLELLASIVRGVVKDEDFLENKPNFNWEEFSAVFSLDEDGDISSNFGYAYDLNSDYCAFSVDPDSVETSIRTYRDWLSGEADKGFIKMLLQFNRDSGQVQADFEYDDEMRWKVTPNNIDDMIEELRPNLGE
ncbi:hypothetical protein [Pseudovibrio sp. Ad37]|uniref:hypothetical protein n=1 Tax=Pseudovibrio sp. Ad37 TaxID=989422 RepID=UPI0007AE9413|nr:hypothetical protein [Pseudovibrio sp. Ad37]KZL25136.1 hypothetical protein PsAD37_02310 [Pseudovibrio sp. Ad37]